VFSECSRVSNVILSRAKDLCPAIRHHAGRFFVLLRMTVAEMLRMTVAGVLGMTVAEMLRMAVAGTLR